MFVLLPSTDKSGLARDPRGLCIRVFPILSRPNPRWPPAYGSGISSAAFNLPRRPLERWGDQIQHRSHAWWSRVGRSIPPVDRSLCDRTDVPGDRDVVDARRYRGRRPPTHFHNDRGPRSCLRSVAPDCQSLYLLLVRLWTPPRRNLERETVLGRLAQFHNSDRRQPARHAESDPRRRQYLLRQSLRTRRLRWTGVDRARDLLCPSIPAAADRQDSDLLTGHCLHSVAWTGAAGRRPPTDTHARANPRRDAPDRQGNSQSFRHVRISDLRDHHRAMAHRQ